MRFAAAIGVIAVVFAASVYIHQRHWYTTACVTDSYFKPCTFQSFKVHPTWEDPVAVLTAIGGLAVAAAIVGRRRRFANPS